MSAEHKDTNTKKSIQDTAKTILAFLKTNKQLDIAGIFAAAVLALILFGTLAWKEPVVPVCLALMLEAGIAILLHNLELWIHGAAMIVELIAGVLIGRTGLMVLCVILYVLTIVALQLLERFEHSGNRA